MIAAVGFVMTGTTTLLFLSRLLFVGSFSAVLLVLFVVFVCLVPSVFLLRAAMIARSFGNRDRANLGDMIAAQRSFWRFVGVITCVVVSLYIMMFAAVFIATFVSRS
jgi:uncharacterized membrane protein